MSVNILTGGLFKQCCFKGGAPPYNSNATERQKPSIMINKVELENKKEVKKFMETIKVRLVDFE